MRAREEWNFEDESGWQSTETVAPKAPGGRRLLALAILIAIGLGVSAILRSATTASPGPTLDVTPQSTLSLENLKAAVDTESMALARGEREVFMARQDAEDVRWYQSQEEFFDRWERPSFEGVPYFVINVGLLPGDRAWVDLRQLRRGGYMRETRFYREQDGQWLRTRPLLAFWGKQRTLDTVHFHAVYADGDDEVVQYVLARFEAAYSRLCVDLGCHIHPERSAKYGIAPEWYSPYPISYSPYPRALAITLLMQPEADRKTWNVLDTGRAVTITMPSPRVSGVVDSWLGQVDDTDLTITDSLVEPAARVASGGIDRWQDRQDGQLFFDAIVEWERDAIRPLTSERLRYLTPQDRFNDVSMLPAEALWNWTPDQSIDPATLDRMREQALSMVVFIGKVYGQVGVSYFASALGSSHSFADAIPSIRLDSETFEARWRAWLGR